MPAEFELLSPTDKPALLAISAPELLPVCRSALTELNYKVHTTANREDFLGRFTQTAYQIVIIEDLFQTDRFAENATLHALQAMPMNQRRHSVIILIGRAVQTLSPMQGFQQSVHAVVNTNDLGSLKQILQKIVADNDLFLNIYRESQLRVAQGKA